MNGINDSLTGIESLKEELQDLCDRVVALTSIYWVCQSMSGDISEISSVDDLTKSYEELNEELDEFISNLGELVNIKVDLKSFFNK